MRMLDCWGGAKRRVAFLLFSLGKHTTKSGSPEKQVSRRNSSSLEERAISPKTVSGSVEPTLQSKLVSAACRGRQRSLLAKLGSDA